MKCASDAFLNSNGYHGPSGPSYKPGGNAHMSRSWRVVSHGVHGRARHNFNFPTDANGNQDAFFKSRNLAINVTAGEVKPNEIASSTLGDAARNFIYWLGEA